MNINYLIIIIIISYILIFGIIYILNSFLEKKDKYERMKESAIQNKIKCERLEMIIRSYRNILLKEETYLKQLPKTDQKYNFVNYIDVKAKLQIIRKIEEDIANEMQKI